MGKAQLSAVLLAMLAVSSNGEIAAATAGEFIGRVAVEWIEGEGPDRDMRLLEPFTFRDASGTEWTVPAGAVVNGASIPRTFWSVVGPPFVGDYRRASVVHDYYCATKEKPWKAVHRMFYNAMIAAGVPVQRAKLLYAAVFGAGPRWSYGAGIAPDGGREIVTVYPELSEDELRRIEQWIGTDDPSLALIESRVQRSIR